MRDVPVLDIQSVSRTFDKGKFTAVENVSLEIQQGKIHSLIGPNGAGKTTLVKMVATILRPSSGRILINGYDTESHIFLARKSMGLVLGGDLGFYPRATAEQNLRFFADIADVETKKIKNEVQRVLEYVELTEWATARVNTFSRGMKQRLHIARSLMGDPALLLLDEPTTGLDPDVALTIRILIKNLSQSGKSILLTSHTMSEIEGLSTNISVIGAGKIHYTGELNDVIKRAGVSATTRATIRAEDMKIIDNIRKLPQVKDIRTLPAGGHWDVTIIWAGKISTEEANTIVHRNFERENANPPLDLASRVANLEDAYLSMAKELKR